ncbi:SGNH/GDSL hydrolase family protein [Lachnospiraceae bacterium 54-11]
MKKKIRVASGSIMAIIIFLSILHYVSGIVERKDSYFKYEPFYEQAEDFDVLFMGTSHVLNAVYPMELWNDYGIVSYNFGGHGNYLPTTYWIMENALEYTNPKLMVIDCFFLGQNEKMRDVDQQHISLDRIPLDKVKADGIRDVVEEEKRLDFIWKFSIYHNRWNELDREDFEKSVSREKGAESRIELTKEPDISEGADIRRLEEETTGVRYLRKMIEECRKRNVDVLLTYLPSPTIKEYQAEVNTVADIAAEYGINYLNFCDLDMLNYEADCADRVFHLNPSGARKVTDYLGNYMKEHYEIPDRRNNPAYDFWYEDYREYENLKLENMQKQTGLDTYLMLQADKNYDIMIEINDKSILGEELYCKLLQNLGIDLLQLSDGTDLILIHKGGEQVVYVNSLKRTGGAADTPLGEVSLYYNDKGEYGVYWDGRECYVVPDDMEYDIRILTYQSESRELLADSREKYKTL